MGKVTGGEVVELVLVDCVVDSTRVGHWMVLCPVGGGGVVEFFVSTFSIKE